MKATALKEYLDKVIVEFGDLEVVVFRGDNTKLEDINNLSRAGINEEVDEQQIWIEI